MGQETITLTSAEMKKVLVVEKILDGHMSNVEGAALLGITPRQVIRLKKKYTGWGAAGIAHHRQFAVKAAEADSVYVKLNPSVKLRHIFTIREHRQLGSSNTLSYGGKLYTLAKPTPFQFNAKTTVEVRETLEGDLILWHKVQALELNLKKPKRYNV